MLRPRLSTGFVLDGQLVPDVRVSIAHGVGGMFQAAGTLILTGGMFGRSWP